MKRKRGNKKGKKPKGASDVVAKEAISSGVIPNAENDSALDDFEKDYGKYDSGMEIDTPSSTGTDQPLNLLSVNIDGSINKGVRKPVGRVKVKLKTPKAMESQLTSSDAPTQSDTDKSSQQLGLNRQGLVADRMEDSANSLPEAKIGLPGNVSKKAGSIKIKSSKFSGSSNNQTTDAGPVKSECPGQKEPKTPHQDLVFDKQELNTALMIIKKVMKMEAAEPFNVPVNPEALGIPDYFDVIDTPMDFGTICSNLEKGDKYMNSEDVFNDVQYIWGNCYKYNNKGDYILDLMRRVKKNFTKYWTAAGLYNGQSRGSNGSEGVQDNAVRSSQVKVPAKGSHSKKTSRKGHGRRHKYDCLCAICVLKRRRREREENARITKSQGGVSDNNLAQEFKQDRQELSPAESPSGNNSSSNMDESSADADADADAETEEKGEVKMPEEEKHYVPEAKKEAEEEEEEEVEEGEESEMEMNNEEKNETPCQYDESREVAGGQSQQIVAEKLASGDKTDSHIEEKLKQHEEGFMTTQQQKDKESQERHQKGKVNRNLHLENPMLLELCGVLFPRKGKSLWNGPHSLAHRKGTARTSSIHTAMDMLMK